MDPATIMLLMGLLGAGGGVASSLMQKKPTKGHMAVIGSNENPGYPAPGHSFYVGANEMGQPDNRTSDAISNGLMGGLGGAMFGHGLGSSAPMNLAPSAGMGGIGGPQIRSTLAADKMSGMPYTNSNLFNQYF